MTLPEAAVDQRDCNLLFRALADDRRRRILSLLGDEPSPVAAADLARELTIEETGRAAEAVTDEETHRRRIDAHHVQLPRLDEAGLIDWDADDGTVARTSHPAYEDPGVQEALSDPASDSWDALFDALGRARNRHVLDILSHQYRGVQVETLARELVAREEDTPEREVSAEDVDRNVSSLRHVQLPKLAERGLIDYDPDAATVAYAGHADLRVPWMHSHVGEGFRRHLSDASPDEEVPTMTGRERIVSYGQSLCDAADDELFLLFTTTGLLEDGCFTRIEQAAERGTAVYLGTRDPAVREYIRENAPEVTVWEPETNWLDLPVGGDTVGRLVFADREALMVGTLGEQSDDGVHAEQAMVGTGQNNTLVAMVRQLLAAQFERFETDAERVETRVSS